jgi:hypothetical protein
MAGWFVLTMGAWLFVKYRRDFPGVRYVDLLWPGRWSHYRVSQGNHYISQSEALFRQGEYTLAMHKLRVGISKAPANAEGRLLLARLHLAYQRPDLAREVLLAGLPHLAGSAFYLQTTLAFLLEFQEDSRLFEVTSGLLANPTNTATRPLLAAFAATAAYHRGDYDAAEDLLERHLPTDSPDRAVLQARIAWSRGFPELALLRLREHLTFHPDNDAARALLADYYQSLGRTADWESALIERVAGDPLAPAPRIAWLQLQHRRGNETRLEQETASYLRQFACEPAALLLLADFAANTGRPVLARRVQHALLPYPENAAAAALVVAEAHLGAAEYQAALDLLAACTRDYPAWTAQFALVLEGLRAVALSGLGRTAEARLHLDRLLAQKYLRPENLVAVAARLSALGARDLAQAAFTRAIETDPPNQAALASLIRLELETGNFARLPGYLAKYLRTRQPSRNLLAHLHTALGSDRHLLLPEQKRLLAAVDAALDTRRP